MTTMYKNMLYVVYKDLNGVTNTGVMYYNISDFLDDTWNPEDRERVIFKMDFRITGKTYREKKEAFENIVKDFQHNDVGGLYWSDYTILTDYFEANARRYGLITELKENGII